MKYFFGIVCFYLVSCTSGDKKPYPNNRQSILREEVLYKTLCASCHRCDKELIGPMLLGAGERWENKELLYEFFRNPSAVVKKNKYASLLFKKYKILMPSFSLTNKEIDDILNYCSNADSGVRY